MSENQEIQFIKPCRDPDGSQRTLTPQYANHLATMGSLVQINIENSSLQRMEKLPDHPTVQDAEKAGLLPLVKLLKSAPIVLSAIGLNEMPQFYVTGARQAYQRFCKEFWPGHNDDIEATHRMVATEATERRVEFIELDEGSRVVYGPAYVALLQMQNIHLSYPECTPTEKFGIYIHSMIGFIDMLSAFELELAKYSFWEPVSRDYALLPETALQRRRDIKRNFTKVERDLGRCRRSAFNGAMDLHWLSGANMAEDIGVYIDTGTGKRKLEQWVGTNDIKLYRISQDMHSVWSQGSRMKRFASAREDELENLPYWREVDRLSSDVLQFRRGRPRRGDKLLGRVDRAVTYIEEQLNQSLLKKTR